MATESVAGSAGDQTERRRAADERRGDFVHRAVTANCDNKIAALGLGALRQIAGMAGVFGQDDARSVTMGERADFVQGSSSPS